MVTRCISHKQLANSNYFSGPVPEESERSDLAVLVPSILCTGNKTFTAVSEVNTGKVEPLIDIHKFSSLKRLIVVISKVKEAVNS